MGADHPYARFRDTEHPRQGLTVIRMHSSTRLPDRQLAAVPGRECGARFHACRRVHLRAKRPFENTRCSGKALPDIAASRHECPTTHEIALWMNGRRLCS